MRPLLDIAKFAIHYINAGIHSGREVLVLEATDTVGSATSSRNSEVIYAGLYYPTNSLKALLCVEGRDKLYDYARERGIEAKRVGKLIVAAPGDDPNYLCKLIKLAKFNNVNDLRALSATEAKALEPEVECIGAVLSPSTGIVDSHSLMTAYVGDLEREGGMIAFNTAVGSARKDGDRIAVEIADGSYCLSARTVINCAGLGSVDFAKRVDGIDKSKIPDLCLAKGNYFSLSGVKSPFQRLIYPVPEVGGLGIHATIDLAGQVKFGPDVEWVDKIEYGVDASRGALFQRAIRRYWPGLPDGALTPSYSGIRPKISGSLEEAKDFIVSGPRSHGVNGLWNLFGIESPGLTASLAIGDFVAREIAAQ